MKKFRNAFTMIELIFVIVVMAIIAKFGVEFIAQAYRNYIYQEITTRLADTSSNAVEIIAKRLQYRIRPSVIVRNSSTNSFTSLEGYDGTGSYNMLEWIGYDVESFREGYWRGVIDKKASMDDGAHLITPGSNLNSVDAFIKNLSSNNSTINDAAIYLFAAENDINSSFGWDGGDWNASDHSLKRAMHWIKETNATAVEPVHGNFAQLFNDIQSRGEWDSRYYLAWSAYAVVHNAATGDLTLFYDYQPWKGEKYTNGKSALLMEHVDTFKMIQREGIIKIQVCTTNDDMNGSSSIDIQRFSLCKEKTIY